MSRSLLYTSVVEAEANRQKSATAAAAPNLVIEAFATEAAAFATEAAAPTTPSLVEAAALATEAVALATALPGLPTEVAALAEVEN